MADLAELTAFLGTLADAAAAAILPHFRAPLAVENKHDTGFDPVTVADRAGEAAMRRLIAEHFPEHGILGEEYGPERVDAPYVWVLDPIDGTRAFITGVPVWGILIGLTLDRVPLLGTMYQPFSGERFWGDGREAWYARGGTTRRLATRPCPGLGEASLLTTSPRIFDATDGVAYDRVEAKARLARYGCDCYAYCMVAAGYADVVVESDLQSYDIVPLIPIITGAGGQVTDWDGDPAPAGGRVLASGDRRVHDEALRLLSE